jgi:hypothetical protein
MLPPLVATMRLTWATSALPWTRTTGTGRRRSPPGPGGRRCRWSRTPGAGRVGSTGWPGRRTRGCLFGCARRPPSHRRNRWCPTLNRGLSSRGSSRDRSCRGFSRDRWNRGFSRDRLSRGFSPGHNPDRCSRHPCSPGHSHRRPPTGADRERPAAADPPPDPTANRAGSRKADSRPCRPRTTPTSRRPGGPVQRLRADRCPQSHRHGPCSRPRVVPTTLGEQAYESVPGRCPSNGERFAHS